MCTCLERRVITHKFVQSLSLTPLPFNDGFKIVYSRHIVIFLECGRVFLAIRYIFMMQTENMSQMPC